MGFRKRRICLEVKERTGVPRFAGTGTKRVPNDFASLMTSQNTKTGNLSVGGMVFRLNRPIAETARLVHSNKMHSGESAIRCEP